MNDWVYACILLVWLKQSPYLKERLLGSVGPTCPLSVPGAHLLPLSAISLKPQPEIAQYIFWFSSLHWFLSHNTPGPPANDTFSLLQRMNESPRRPSPFPERVSTGQPHWCWPPMLKLGLPHRGHHPSPRAYLLLGYFNTVRFIKFQHLRKGEKSINYMWL